MHIVKSLTRRGFGRGALALAALPVTSAHAHNGVRHWTVQIAKFKFEPNVLTIGAGDTVTWHNADFAPHTATHDDGEWTTGELEKGAEVEIEFPTKGQHDYFCDYHPQMRARIVVE